MAKKLFYLPLEGYPERYTHQWSAPETGWLERNWRRAGVDYFRVNGPNPDTDWHRRNSAPIKTGSVVDAGARARHCFVQIARLIDEMDEGGLTSDDVIFLDDFWTPGLEALRYAMDLKGVRPKLYAFLHAQSVDEYDFTTKMLPWIRHVEVGYAEMMDGIFVCCPSLAALVGRDLLGSARHPKVHVTGHPFNSEEVRERMGDVGWFREDRVVWSSRWDAEKQPEFFLKVCEEVWEKNPHVEFAVCTSAPELRSNDPALLRLARETAARRPRQFRILEGLSKEQYYSVLAKSKVQFNCALQDWVAITLLEASVAGCYPVYPRFRSFPETFLGDLGKEFLYEPWNARGAAGMILEAVSRPAEPGGPWDAEARGRRGWIHSRFDQSWLRMLDVMGVAAPGATAAERAAASRPMF